MGCRVLSTRATTRAAFLDKPFAGGIASSCMGFFGSKRAVVCFSGMAAMPFLLMGAVKPQTAVIGVWRGAPSSIPLCVPLNLVLHVVAHANAAELSAEVLPSAGIEVVSGTHRWVGSLLAGQVLDLPLRVRVIAAAVWQHLRQGCQ